MLAPGFRRPVPRPAETHHLRPVAGEHGRVVSGEKPLHSAEKDQDTEHGSQPVPRPRPFSGSFLTFLSCYALLHGTGSLTLLLSHLLGYSLIHFLDPALQVLQPRPSLFHAHLYVTEICLWPDGLAE